VSSVDLSVPDVPDTLGAEASREKVRSARGSVGRRSDLEKARELLQIERDRAVRKIYKMATSDDGADIRGTKYDPIGKSAVGRVTLKNATKELERLSEFNNSSSVWYYRDKTGGVIPAKTVRRYREAVLRYNSDIDQYERSVSGTKLPYMGDMTVGDWIRDFRPKKQYLPGGSHYALERMNPDKRPSNFEDVAAMRAKTKAVEDSLTKTAKAKRLTAAKRQVAAMLDAIGDPELYDILTEIPDDVLWLMWTVSGDFANQLSLMYEAAKEGYNDRKASGDDIWYDEYENAGSSIKSLLKEIKSIKIKPEDDFSASPVNKRRKGKRR
jgi:terminal protein